MRAFDRDKESDLAILNKWLKARGKPPLEWDDVPKHGVIEDDVAVGFLCTTDSDTAFLDGFVSNPHADGDLRHDAFLEIVEWAYGMAEIFGYKKVIALTKDEGLIKRAINFGFEPVDLFCFVKRTRKKHFQDYSI